MIFLSNQPGKLLWFFAVFFFAPYGGGCPSERREKATRIKSHDELQSVFNRSSTVSVASYMGRGGCAGAISASARVAQHTRKSQRFGKKIIYLVTNTHVA